MHYRRRFHKLCELAAEIIKTIPSHAVGMGRLVEKSVYHFIFACRRYVAQDSYRWSHPYGMQEIKGVIFFYQTVHP